MDPSLSDDEDEEEDLSYNKRSYDKNSFQASDNAEDTDESITSV